ncbi:PAS domain S-box protein [Paramagnetospirillum magneticum]|uniref:histidine kinase n=1 Tax=Paramagnetospirillum magneticum (strain ATCC 700264 / AMB-1) TaxID=342108 RepID=Q2W5R5_PARM1|nr:PAS domain S-box protein [Paramagnetospirillum magneticum]BAE50810.1 Signal transduction histidine kinase [Paramagnetospirillum magneticum AMB-1]
MSDGLSVSGEIPTLADVTAKVVRYAAAGLFSWSLLLGGSLAWNIAKQREITLELATNTAQANFNKDVAYRLWASSHGGVYVEPDAKTPPSPWMAHLPDRDLIANDGRKLTLMNPAYMLRQMMQDHGELYGIKGRIVGIVTLNSDNTADPWEAEAIRQFAAGTKSEVMEVSDIDGKPFLRLFKPFRMEPSCQKCHGHLGFQDGEVRGGIGVSVPLAPYLTGEANVVRTMATTHGAIWGLGMLAIGWIARRSHSRLAANARMTRALHDSEKHYRAIVETSSDGFWMTDNRGQLLEVNHAYAARSGYSREQLLSMSIQDLEAIETDDATHARIAAVMAGQDLRFETRHRTRNGEIWDVEVSTSYFAGGDGRLFVFLRDISERKRDERVLAESERRFREMAETIDQVFYVADQDYSRFHYISPAFLRLWGHAPEVLMAEPSLWRDWVHPEDRDGVMNLLAARIGSGEYAADFRIIRPDGEIVWLHAKAFEVANPTSGQPYVLGFHTDITMAKSIEAELRDKNQALERSNAELEAYAYVASHDLREPLRNITAFSTLLRRRLEGRLDDEEQEFLKIVTDAANRMDCLVRDLLELSRIGRNERDMHLVSLSELMQAAKSSLRSQMEAAQADISITSPLPVIMGNDDELYRVLLNLFGNAIKYRGEGPVHIAVHCEAEGPELWRMTIADNGIGMELGKGYEERIFGLFQRLHQRDEYGGGTGIGLPVCRKIIERHGGRIWAETDGPGKGTRMIFVLPKLPD